MTLSSHAVLWMAPSANGIPQESTKDQDPYVLGRAFSHQSSLISGPRPKKMTRILNPHLSHEEYEDIL